MKRLPYVYPFPPTGEGENDGKENRIIFLAVLIKHLQLVRGD